MCEECGVPEDDGGGEWSENLPATRLQWPDFPILALNATGVILRVVGDTFVNAAQVLGMHANYRIAQRQMVEQVHADIESL